MDKSSQRMISLVGGGGKTTTMYALAHMFQKAGKKVVVTTSTHLQAPPEDIRARKIEEIRTLWKSGQIAVIGTDCESDKKVESDGQTKKIKSVKKISMPEPVFLKEALQEADVVLIEADGAKHLPCKVPIEKEPVILPECTDVIAVMGMDALGKPLEEVCFRRDLAVQFLGTDYKHLMTEEDLVKILLSEQGSRKDVGKRNYVVILNQCEEKHIRERAEFIRSLLKLQGVEQVAITSDVNREEELKKYFM